MKEFFLSAACFLWVIFSFSQKQPNTVGKWNVVSVADGEFFMDFKKDSISINEELKSNYPDDASVKRKKSSVENQYGKTYFVFEADGTFKKLQADKIKISGTYKIDFPGKGTIRISYKDESGKQIIDDCNFFDIPPFMLFSMNNNSVRFMLERVK